MKPSIFSISSRTSTPWASWSTFITYKGIIWIRISNCISCEKKTEHSIFCTFSDRKLTIKYSWESLWQLNIMHLQVVFKHGKNKGNMICIIVLRIDSMVLLHRFISSCFSLLQKAGKDGSQKRTNYSSPFITRHTTLRLFWHSCYNLSLVHIALDFEGMQMPTSFSERTRDPKHRK